jgi:hypothetical protein
MSFGGGFGGFGSNNNTQSTGFGGFGAANTNTNTSAGKSMLFFQSRDGAGPLPSAMRPPATSARGHSTNLV